MVTLGARRSSAERSRALCIWGLETSKALSGEQLVLRLLCLRGAGPVAWAWFAPPSPPRSPLEGLSQPRPSCGPSPTCIFPVATCLWVQLRPVLVDAT